MPRTTPYTTFLPMTEDETTILTTALTSMIYGDHAPRVAAGAERLLDRLTREGGTVRVRLLHILAHDRNLDDPKGDGSGVDAESPTGDDYNDVVSALSPLFTMIGEKWP